MKGPIKTTIHEGQTYYDETVLAKPRADLRTPIADSVATIFGSHQPTPIVVGHNRIRLRWVKPDGKGGVVPR